MNNKEKIRKLILECKDSNLPRISLVMPTHKKSPDNKKDMILYKNLLHNIKTALEGQYARSIYENTLEKLQKIQEDTMFWMYNSDGLLVLACGDTIETFRLQYPVMEKISVSDAFHIQPIFAQQEIFGKHYLIDLAKDRFKLYRISQNKIIEMNDLEIKTSFSELYDDFDMDSNVNVGTYGGLSGMYHGHREKSEETKKDREKYFRYLDREFKKLHQIDGSHFIFAGTTENIMTFKHISQENFYHELTINHPLSSLKPEEIEEVINDILQPLVDETKNMIEQDIRKSKYNDNYVNDFSIIQEASKEGRIRKLIIKEKQTMAVNIPLDNVVNEVIVYHGDIIVFDEDTIDLKDDITAIIR